MHVSKSCIYAIPARLPVAAKHCMVYLAQWHVQHVEVHERVRAACESVPARRIFEIASSQAGILQNLTTPCTLADACVSWSISVP